MKKNLKIVSAAAAALLAVAPIAASAIPVGAASGSTINPIVSDGNSDVNDTNITIDLSVSNSDQILPGTKLSDLHVSLNSNEGTLTITKNNKHVVIYDVTGKTPSNGQYDLTGLKPASKLEPGKNYIAVAQGVYLSSLNPNENYTVNGQNIKTNAIGDANTGVDVQSKAFTVLASDADEPQFIINSTKKAINTKKSGSITLASNTVQDILNKFNAKYSVANQNKDLKASLTTNAKDIEKQLTAQGITVNSDGSFSPSSNNLSLTFTAKSGNKTVSYEVNVRTNGYSKPNKPSKHTAKGNVKRLRLKKNAYIYNQNHKRVGRTVYKKGSAHNVKANNVGAQWFNKGNGFIAYQLSDGRYKGDYIDVRNFGVKVSNPKKTRRTRTAYKKARVRSRVFYANGKAVRRYYIGKNTNIRVYGTKRIHGQNYYVIGKGRYVKTSNFR